MTTSELIALLTKQLNKNGNHEVVINDSHGNTCAIGKLEFIRHAHPVVVVHTKP